MLGTDINSQVAEMILMMRHTKSGLIYRNGASGGLSGSKKVDCCADKCQ